MLLSHIKHVKIKYKYDLLINFKNNVESISYLRDEK